ncbi:MAG: hypothetical protein WCL14_02605 [Bacteroidota bacterium]
MALTKLHIHEEIEGVKCSVVEKNCSKERVDFLKRLLEYNGFEVKFAITPNKVAPKPIDPNAPIAEATPIIENYTIGVTDIVFNPVHALYSRLLKTPNGHVVTAAYWQQREEISHDEIPYYERR